MRNNARLNGCDYLMLGFDHELRRGGFAGNLCQIVLELGSAISLDALKKRLGDLINHFPILRARPGGMVFPRWNSLGHAATAPQIRMHSGEPALARKIFNEPLAMNRGELLRRRIAKVRPHQARRPAHECHFHLDACSNGRARRGTFSCPGQPRGSPFAGAAITSGSPAKVIS